MACQLLRALDDRLADDEQAGADGDDGPEHAHEEIGGVGELPALPVTEIADVEVADHHVGQADAEEDGMLPQHLEGQDVPAVQPVSHDAIAQ